MKRHNINHGEADHMNTQYYLADEVDAELERYETARQEDARRLEQVKGELDAILEALKPFANAAESIDVRPISKDWRDSKTITTGIMVFDVITVGDLRRAAAALKDAK